MGTKTYIKDGVTSVAKYTYKGKTLTPEQFIAPFRKSFEQTESEDWASKKKGLHSKPHVIILRPEFMRRKKGDKGESVLVRDDITKEELMAAAKEKVVNWRPKGRIQKAIKEFNLKQFKRTVHNDYILVYNFGHARAIFDHLKDKKLIKGGITDRGHVKAKTRYHAESELDRLGEFEKWGKGTHKGAYLSTRAVQKKLREEAAALTPDIDHSWLVRVNREVKQIRGLDTFLAIIPEPAWKNRSKKEEGDLKRAFTKHIEDWLKRMPPDVILQVTHSKSTEQILSDKITDLLIGKKVAAYNTKGSKRYKSKKRKITLNEFKTAKPPPLRTSGGKFTSAMNIQAILNNRIKEEVADNMGKGGALVYRTGRFANSVSVTKVMQSRQGALTAFYTYMKAPYQTFERGYAQGSLRRDPRKLIAASIREIARETLNHKLQIRTRRV